MTTPIRDFVESYVASRTARLHMPGHKGRGPLGCEALDVTEVSGADALYEAEGVIAESEQNATALFETGRTLYSTEGSSQCIRAMLFLALTGADAEGERPLCLAARNAHKTFLFAAALCDFDVEWLWPETQSGSICACPISPEGLERALNALARRPFCVYVTTPDYLGGQLDVGALARVCHAHGVPLLVDNAHGAYLKFLPGARHPMELGADLCCDSAHKTLPVLTGGAYLHISQGALARYGEGAKRSLALFGSTSPSYLILQSLDCANAALATDFPARLGECCARVSALKSALRARGFDVLPTEPAKLTLRTDGLRAAELLRGAGAECEFADVNHLVLMFSPENAPEDYARVERALTHPLAVPGAEGELALRTERVLNIRAAMFSPAERIPVEASAGRVCAAPTVSCPPAVPIAVSGERITPAHIRALQACGMREIAVVRGM